MKIKMLKDYAERISSGRSRHYREGKTYTVRKELGEQMIAAKAAVISGSEPKTSEET